MKSASDNIPALYFYVESWITGTQDLTPQQRGIYIQLLSHAQVRNGRGLPNDIVKLSRLCLLCNPDDLNNWEEQKKDLYFILKSKFILKANEDGVDAYFNERQQKEYEIARKKKDQVLKANEKYNKKRTNNNDVVTTSLDSDSDSDSDNNISINKKAKLFAIFWELNKNKIQVGYAKKAWVKLPNDWVQKPEELARLYNNHFADKKDFAKHPSSWLNAEAYLDQKPDMSDPVSSDNSPARLKMFQSDKITPFLITYAQRYEQEVRQAVENKDITLERAKELGINVR